VGGPTLQGVAPGTPRTGVPSAPRDRDRALARSWPSLAAGAVAVVLLARLAWDAGGYFPSAFVAAGALAFAALGALLLAHLPHYRFSTHALTGFGTLGLLAAWTGASALWSPAPDAALEDLQRDLLYVALFGLGLLAAGSGRHARVLVWAMLAFVVAVAGAGLLGRLEPSLGIGGPEPAGVAAHRLSGPLGYWNAFGALAAMGTVLAAGLAADARSRPVLRAAASAGAVLLAVAMYLSLSRGAWLALVAGLVVLAALGARRAGLLATLGVAGGAAALAILRLRGYPALTGDPVAAGGQAAAGRAYLPQLLALVAGAAAAQGALAVAGGPSSHRVRAGTRRLAPAAAAVVAVLALGAYLAAPGRVEGRTARVTTDASRWLSDQWRDFLRPTTTLADGSARLTSAKGTRSDLYRVAVDAFEAHPLRGEGSGSFEQRWMRTRRVDEKVRDAHSLELQTLGELGVVGAVLLLAFLAALGAAAVRSRVRPGALGRSQAAAVAAACAVWVVHAAVDWDWQVPALTGTALVLAAVLFPEGRRRRRTGNRSIKA
jgi:O-Antigen ligase